MSPGLEKRETWGTPGFPLSAVKNDSRYNRAGDVGHPPSLHLTVDQISRTVHCTILTESVPFIVTPVPVFPLTTPDVSVS